MCNSLMCTIADWLGFIAICWLGFLVVAAFTIAIWQIIKTMLED